jgi:hypothetical protein
MTRAEWTREALERAGFTGWHGFGGLRSHLGSIDRSAGGVYVVYREMLDPPVWLDKNPGGTWRGDPTVSRDDLVANWVEGANVVNIGKANHGQLRNRLRAYCSFGEGGKGRHYGGRLIWQLEASSYLLVAWRVITDLSANPYDVEQEMIRRFRAVYGKPPFANNPHLLGA